MHTDTDRCLRAVRARDARFDGRFFTGVRTTGIYCRPSCPAITPRPGNVRFFPSAAAAQRDGFRACKRCRPDAVPGSAAWDPRGDVVARAVRSIADGVVDREGVTGLATRLGYSVRQLERLLVAELGAGPRALARAQRAQTARTLLEATDLPVAEVAFAAGFSSIRACNDTMRAVYAATPTELRAGRAATPSDGAAPATDGPAGLLHLRLPYRRPLHAAHLFGRLRANAVPGVEEWRDDRYRRTLRLPHGHGIVALRDADGHVDCALRLSDHRDLPAAIARLRALLDLDADPEAIDDVLADDPSLRAGVRSAPGRRVARTVDAHELAVRAVLGQQVSRAAAATHAARLAERHGEPVHDPDGGLTRLFPTAARLGEADLSVLRVPASRQQALRALAQALAGGDLDLGPGCDRERATAMLTSLPGIGAWTAALIALRGLGDPDAFPVTDLGVRIGAGALGLPTTRAALTRHAQAWRPWRAYAVQHLWCAHDPTADDDGPRARSSGAGPEGHDPRTPGRDDEEEAA